MRRVPVVIVSLCFVLFCTLKNCLARREKNVYCGACLALLDEMNWEIGQVDSKKKIQVGSFRIDSKGNQDLREIPLARSAVHLTDLLENICSQMSNYAISTNADGRLSYVRTSSRDGSAVSLTNIEITGEVHSQLKFACESLIEEHEEDLIPSFQVGLDSMSEIICCDLMSVCSKTNITDYEEATKAVRTSPTKESGGANDEDGDEEDGDEEDEGEEESKSAADDDTVEPTEIKQEL